MSTLDVILFYSNGSQHSRNLIKLLTELRIRLNMVSLDNKTNRDMVTRNKGFQITKVPTIMVVKSDGVIEAYVGQDAVSWVYSVAQQTHPVQPEPQQPPRKAKKPQAAILKTPPPQEELEEPEEDEEEPLEEDEEIIDEDAKSKPERAKTSSSSSMASIMAEAKKMEKQRAQQINVAGINDQV